MEGKEFVDDDIKKEEIETCQFPLHEAALLGDIDEVKKLLDDGADVNEICDVFEKPHRNSSPLHCASTKGHLDVVELLVKRGADINYQNERGFTALNGAIWYEHPEVAEFLIKQGANLNLQNNPEGYTALMSAINRSEESLIIQLLLHDADVNVVTANGTKALNYVTEKPELDARLRFLYLKLHNLFCSCYKQP